MPNLSMNRCPQSKADLSQREAGNTTFLALFMLALLLFIGATVLSNASRLYNGNQKVEGWQEALNAAEAGADLALANLRWTVTASPSPIPSPAFNPSPSPGQPAWTTTTTTDGNGNITNTIYTCTTPHITQSGEGTNETWAVITVDSPIGDNTTSPPSGLTYNGNQWYRIRSIGHARIPGLTRASVDILSDANARHDNSLRKFSMFFDRTIVKGLAPSPAPLSAAISVPEATRIVEVIVQPKTTYLPAMLAVNSLTFKPGKPQNIDSYDPSDPTKSTNGLYDPTKRGTNGGVGVGANRDGTNYTSASNDLTLGSGSKLYGNASTNGGSFTDPNNDIVSPGIIMNNYAANLPQIKTPGWTSQPSQINGSVTTVTSAKTITGTSGGINNYKIATITAPLTISGTGTVNIYLTGDVTTAGYIIINKGVSLNIYFAGGTFHPNNDNSINNLNKDPSTFNLYGVGTLSGSGPGIDIHTGGTTQAFYGSVYAPYRLLNLKYDGSTPFDSVGGFFGSFIGDTINMTGPVHYDEELASQGESVIDYDRVSFVEDPR